MSLGESKRSRKGRESEPEGRWRSLSGEVAATEASLERKGSLGLIGGIGILAEHVGFMEQWVLKIGRVVDGEDEDGMEEAMGSWREAAMAVEARVRMVQKLVQCSLLVWYRGVQR